MNQIKNKWIKKLIFVFATIIIIVIALEIVLRCFYYQVHSTDRLALSTAFKSARYRLVYALTMYKFNKLKLDEGHVYVALYSKEGNELLHYFQKEYENYFKKLLEETKKINSKLIVLYIPRDNYITWAKIRDNNRAFFSSLAKKYNVDYVDLTEEFLKYPVKWVIRLPEDTHPSRLGNQLIADVLYENLKKYNEYRSDVHFKERPALLGDFAPGTNSVFGLWSFMPYRVETNNQGLRMNYDLNFPKKKQRILIMGDSFTFGSGLPNCYTYAYFLNRRYPQKEVINAGIVGYTIIDELSLFQDRAKFTEPDITVVQVLDNDLYELFYYKRAFGRKIEFLEPTALEKKYLFGKGSRL